MASSSFADVYHARKKEVSKNKIVQDIQPIIETSIENRNSLDFIEKLKDYLKIPISDVHSTIKIE